MAKKTDNPIRLVEGKQNLGHSAQPAQLGEKLKPPSPTILLPPQWIAPIRPIPKDSAPPAPLQNEKRD